MALLFAHALDFKTKVSNAWDKKGLQWLNQLPELVEKLKAHWQLDHIHPVGNMSRVFQYEMSLSEG